MTILIDTRPLPCPRCGEHLRRWNREELHDGVSPRIVRTVECGCGWCGELEPTIVGWRPRGQAA